MLVSACELDNFVQQCFSAVQALSKLFFHRSKFGSTNITFAA